MGLCPDCAQEGETISYIGASKADVLDDVRGADEDPSSENDAESSPEITEEDGKVCDLCEKRYLPV